MNIITSHSKEGEAGETKRDIPTFFRLACRFIADSSLRLKDLILFENATINLEMKYFMTFGFRSDIIIDNIDNIDRIPQEIYRHDITESLSSKYLIDISNYYDNVFDCVEINLLEVEQTRIKFGKEYFQIISVLAYYLREGILISSPLYGPNIWIKQP